MMKSISYSRDNGGFSYWKFLFKRIVRLWPIVLIVSATALCIGYFLMLPDDFENLGESAFAAAAFANNILAYMTTKNYWNPTNTYRPLMHTWYIGLLMQAYVVIPAILAAADRVRGDKAGAQRRALAVLTCISLVLFLLPVFSEEQKFYHLPFRVFEIALGGWIAARPVDGAAKGAKNRLAFVEAACLALLLGLFCARGVLLPSPVRLLLTVFCTAALLVVFGDLKERRNPLMEGIAAIGKCSLSVYLWHQVIIAFMYYSFAERLSVVSFIACVAVTAAVSALSYRFIERPLEGVAKYKRTRTRGIAVCCLAALMLFAASGAVYLRAGVVRDVPELGITTDNVHRGMHAEYCDRPYAWDVAFSDDARTKIFVIGNSFGRDWANILAESDIADEIEISYAFFEDTDAFISACAERFERADRVFYALGPGLAGVPERILSQAPREKLYIIGNKSFGVSNGIVYRHRNDPDYFERSIALDESLLAENERQKALYPAHYVDLIGAVQREDGSVRVFTSDGKYISQDCEHLTRFGAQYYAQILDLSWIVEE